MCIYYLYIYIYYICVCKVHFFIETGMGSNWGALCTLLIIITSFLITNIMWRKQTKHQQNQFSSSPTYFFMLKKTNFTQIKKRFVQFSFLGISDQFVPRLAYGEGSALSHAMQCEANWSCNTTQWKTQQQHNTAVSHCTTLFWVIAKQCLWVGRR